MDIETPDNWRKGQTIFNFLEWLKKNKEIENAQSARMADPFYLDDEELEEFWQEFIEEHEQLEE